MGLDLHGCRNPVDVVVHATEHDTAAMQGLAYDVAEDNNIDWAAALSEQLKLIASMEASFCQLRVEDVPEHVFYISPCQ